VLFVCENNGWAEFSSRAEHTTVGNVVRYGDLYGIPAREVDGTDVDLVIAAVQELLALVRAGGGPCLLECHIARLRPHYEGDWREHSADGDPLNVTEERLIAAGIDPVALAARRDAELQQALALLESVLADEPVANPADDPSLVFARTP
jgi:TPP-dependent pyruvate/acetoin dehydrogenase alpha subunit